MTGEELYGECGDIEQKVWKALAAEFLDAGERGLPSGTAML